MIYRVGKLYHYSEFSVNFKISKDLVIQDCINSLGNDETFEDYDGTERVIYYYSFNEWESNYFNIKSIFLKFIDFKNENYQLSQDSITRFTSYLYQKYGEYIITSEIPSHDNKIIQSLNESSFRLIETRLHYQKSDLENFNMPRFSVRNANSSDIDNLKKQAMFMRNDYDRFHSDNYFTLELADYYLSTYIENSINGFADIVIVPSGTDIQSDSFLTANILKHKWDKLNHRISKMVLSAVSSKTNLGWYIKLISEMTYILKNEGSETIFMNTQSTNIAVLHTWEKLGYKIGRASHIFSKKVSM